RQPRSSTPPRADSTRSPTTSLAKPSPRTRGRNSERSTTPSRPSARTKETPRTSDQDYHHRQGRRGRARDSRKERTPRMVHHHDERSARDREGKTDDRNQRDQGRSLAHRQRARLHGQLRRGGYRPHALRAIGGPRGPPQPRRGRRGLVRGEDPRLPRERRSHPRRRQTGHRRDEVQGAVPRDRGDMRDVQRREGPP